MYMHKIYKYFVSIYIYIYDIGFRVCGLGLPCALGGKGWRGGGLGSFGLEPVGLNPTPERLRQRAKASKSFREGYDEALEGGLQGFAVEGGLSLASRISGLRFRV